MAMRALAFLILFSLGGCVHDLPGLCGEALEQRISQDIRVVDVGERVDATTDENARTPAQVHAVAQADAIMNAHDRVVDASDLAILDHALALITTESQWNRADTRQCDPADSRFTLFCALQKASIEVLGQYEHRRAALQEVRFAVEEATVGRQYEHRLRDFNNDPRTTLTDLRSMIAIARQRVSARLRQEQQGCHG
jgi:hypothetical protein